MRHRGIKVALTLHVGTQVVRTFVHQIQVDAALFVDRHQPLDGAPAVLRAIHLHPHQRSLPRPERVVQLVGVGVILLRLERHRAGPALLLVVVLAQPCQGAAHRLAVHFLARLQLADLAKFFERHARRSIHLHIADLRLRTRLNVVDDVHLRVGSVQLLAPLHLCLVKTAVRQRLLNRSLGRIQLPLRVARTRLQPGRARQLPLLPLAVDAEELDTPDEQPRPPREHHHHPAVGAKPLDLDGVVETRFVEPPQARPHLVLGKHIARLQLQLRRHRPQHRRLDAIKSDARHLAPGKGRNAGQGRGLSGLRLLSGPRCGRLWQELRSRGRLAARGPVRRWSPGARRLRTAEVHRRLATATAQHRNAAAPPPGRSMVQRFCERSRPAGERYRASPVKKSRVSPCSAVHRIRKNALTHYGQRASQGFAPPGLSPMELSRALPYRWKPRQRSFRRTFSRRKRQCVASSPRPRQ